MKRIPRKFRMGAHEIVVQIVSREEMGRLADDKDNPPWGLYKPGENRIYVQEVRRGLNRQAQLHTFYHELFHALFWNLGRLGMYEDEVLVDQSANLLMQALQSAE